LSRQAEREDQVDQGGKCCFTLLPRRRGRPKTVSDDDRRAAIVALAHRSFLVDGYGGTSMDGIAAACRISKQTLYRLFPSKGDLFMAVLHVFRSQILDFSRADDDMPLQTALEQIFLIDISADADRARAEFIGMVITESHHYPELHDLMHRYGAYMTRDLLGAWLAGQCIRRGVAMPDPERCAGMLIDMVFGPLAIKHACHEPVEPDERRAHVRRAIHVFLNGVQAPPLG
jgi:AcrR family transcriptional regulator